MKYFHIYYYNELKEMKLVLRIMVSFKKTKRDMKLYEIVKKQEEQSDFVKDAIEFFIKNKPDENGQTYPQR